MALAILNVLLCMLVCVTLLVSYLSWWEWRADRAKRRAYDALWRLRELTKGSEGIEPGDTDERLYGLAWQAYSDLDAKHRELCRPLLRDDVWPWPSPKTAFKNLRNACKPWATLATAGKIEAEAQSWVQRLAEHEVGPGAAGSANDRFSEPEFDRRLARSTSMLRAFFVIGISGFVLCESFIFYHTVGFKQWWEGLVPAMLAFPLLCLGLDICRETCRAILASRFKRLLAESGGALIICLALLPLPLMLFLWLAAGLAPGHIGNVDGFCEAWKAAMCMALVHGWLYVCKLPVSLQSLYRRFQEEWATGASATAGQSEV